MQRPQDNCEVSSLFALHTDSGDPPLPVRLASLAAESLHQPYFRAFIHQSINQQNAWFHYGLFLVNIMYLGHSTLHYPLLFPFLVAPFLPNMCYNFENVLGFINNALNTVTAYFSMGISQITVLQGIRSSLAPLVHRCPRAPAPPFCS